MNSGPGALVVNVGSTRRQHGERGHRRERGRRASALNDGAWSRSAPIITRQPEDAVGGDHRPPRTPCRARASALPASPTISVTISADLDHRHRDGEHERAERLADAVRHHLGEVDRGQHRGGEEDADDDQHERRRLRSPREGEHDERRHCRRVPEVHFLGRSIAGMAERTSYPPGPSPGQSWRRATPTPRRPSTASCSGGTTTTTRSATGRCTRWRTRDGEHGRRAVPDADQPPHWNCYVTVASADDSAAKAANARGGACCTSRSTSWTSAAWRCSSIRPRAPRSACGSRARASARRSSTRPAR